jgi:exosortase family protein XrtG
MPDWLLIAAFGLWAATVAYLRWTRNWLFFFVVGVAGAAYALVFVCTRVVRVDMALAAVVGSAVHWLCGLIGVPTRVFDSAPDVLMVLVISQPVGWTTLQIGVESSGILEVCVLTALLLFYPGRAPLERALAIVIGVAATLAANTVRVFVIALMLHYGGKEALVLAHTYVGKLLFFVLMVGIVWALLTAPMLRTLARALAAPEPARRESSSGSA